MNTGSQVRSYIRYGTIILSGRFVAISRNNFVLLDSLNLQKLVYQTTVFFSRSTISMGIPPIPSRFLSMPAIIQFFVLVILGLESATGLFESGSSATNPTPEGWEGASVIIVFLLICVEGIGGGLA
jgi:battenin